MPSSTGNKMLLEHLHKLTAQHEREQIMKTVSASSKKPDRFSATDPDSRKSSETSSFYSSSSEDVERGGGVKLTGPDAFVAHNNPYALLDDGAAADARRPVHADSSSLRGSPRQVSLIVLLTLNFPVVANHYSTASPAVRRLQLKLCALPRPPRPLCK